MFVSVQFATDGDHIQEYRCDSINEVWDMVNDQGSRWYFYPLPMVVDDGRDVIVSAPDGFHFLESMGVIDAATWITENEEYIVDVISG